MILEEAEFQATIPATDLDRARRFYEGKLGLSPERVMDVGVIYRFGKDTAFFLYPSATAGAGHKVGSWFVAELAAWFKDSEGNIIAVSHLKD